MYTMQFWKALAVKAQLALRLLALLAIGFVPVLAVPSAQAANPGQCLLKSSKPLLISSSASLGGVVIDDQCEKVYISNSSANTVDIYSVTNGTKIASVGVGARPSGLDLSADGTKLFVANTGAQSVSVVDVATNTETHRYVFASNFINDTPYSIAAARNGLVFFTTTFSGSGFGGRMMQLDPASGAITQRTDFWFGGTNTEITRIASNADHSLLAVVAGDISSGPVFKYASSTNTFTNEKDLNAFVSSVALDTAGDIVLVDSGTYVLDGNLSQIGIVTGGSYGVAVDPAGNLGYAVSSASQVNVLDLKTVTQTGTLAIGDTVASANYYGFGTGVGQMTISRDGGLLAIITDHGLSLVPTGVVHVVPFATFSARVNLDIREGTSASSSSDEFAAEGHFTLGAGRNGIDLVANPLNFQIGSFNISIPPGSFSGDRESLRYDGKIADYDVRAQIKPSAHGGYQFTLRVKGVNLAGSVLPLTATLAIGDDVGTIALPTGNARFVDTVATSKKDD
ncbi:MAG: hypothetical protein EKK47_15000 [Burkholderiales bacterium]|nr:MAG: hypothetical protein EKK47_15000 [Burkholderiales bacterium]